MNLDYDGGCLTVMIENRGDGSGEHVMVICADPATLITAEMLCEVIAGQTRFEFGEGVMWVGTEGAGLGRVAYEVDDPQFRDWLLGRVDLVTLTMRRIA